MPNKFYEVRQTVTFIKYYVADSAREAEEFFSEDNADTISKDPKARLLKEHEVKELVSMGVTFE